MNIQRKFLVSKWTNHVLPFGFGASQFRHFSQTDRGPFEKHFKTLGLSNSASSQEVKEAFIRMAKAYHPDSHPPAERKKYEEMFKTVNEAYMVLSERTQSWEKERKFSTKYNMYQSDVEFVKKQKEYYEKRKRDAERNGTEFNSHFRYSTDPRYEHIVNPQRQESLSFGQWLRRKSADPEGILFYLFVIACLIRYYYFLKTQRLGTGVFSEEEDDRYVEEINRQNELKKRRQLTPTECRHYSIDDLSNMERNGMVELPKAYQQIVEEHREMYDSERRYEKIRKEQRDHRIKRIEENERKIKKIREKWRKEDGLENENISKVKPGSPSN